MSASAYFMDANYYALLLSNYGQDCQVLLQTFWNQVVQNPTISMYRRVLISLTRQLVQSVKDYYLSNALGATWLRYLFPYHTSILLEMASYLLLLSIILLLGSFVLDLTGNEPLVTVKPLVVAAPVTPVVTVSSRKTNIKAFVESKVSFHA